MSQRGNPTIKVRSDEGFDEARLVRYLQGCFDDLGEVLTVSQYPNGRSNLTYRLEFADRRLVLRRPPFGTKAKSAHDMSREFAVLRGLKTAFDAVPEAFIYCDDESIIGSEFYVMDEVEGVLVGRDFPEEFGWGPLERRRFCEGFWDRLIELHALDYQQVGLGGIGKPDGYVERQIKGWNRRYAKAHTPDAPECKGIMKWLEDRLPGDGEACVLHNDYRIDNMILCPDDPFRIAAILDWEMAAVGHPLMDLGNSLAYWIEASDSSEARQHLSQPTDRPGMLLRRDIVAYYGSRTGRDLGEIGYYYVYGLFRLAAIIQQIYYRYYHRQTADERFAGWVSEVHRLSRRCQEVIDGGAF